MSHDGVTKKEIDHVLKRQRGRGLLKSCQTYHSTEVQANTDHFLVSELQLTLLKASRKTPVCQAPFDIARLTQNSALQQQYVVIVQNTFDCLGTLPDDADDDVHRDSFCTKSYEAPPMQSLVHERTPGRGMPENRRPPETTADHPELPGKPQTTAEHTAEHGRSGSKTAEQQCVLDYRR